MGVSGLIAVVHLIPFLWTLCLGDLIFAFLVHTGGKTCLRKCEENIHFK